MARPGSGQVNIAAELFLASLFANSLHSVSLCFMVSLIGSYKNLECRKNGETISG